MKFGLYQLSLIRLILKTGVLVHEVYCSRQREADERLEAAKLISIQNRKPMQNEGESNKKLMKNEDKIKNKSKKNGDGNKQLVDQKPAEKTLR